MGLKLGLSPKRTTEIKGVWEQGAEGNISVKERIQKFHNKMFHTLHSSPNKTLVREYEEKKPFGRPKHRLGV
jgi:hypothetical protein